MKASYERVPKTDWPLFRLWQHTKNMDIPAFWTVDRQQNAYLYWVCKRRSDQRWLYVLVWHDTPIYLTVENRTYITGARACDITTHWCIDTLYVPPALLASAEHVKSIILLIETMAPAAYQYGLMIDSIRTITAYNGEELAA